MPPKKAAPSAPPSSPSSYLIDIQLKAALITLAAVHVHLAPYTKVEESFNVQALHDWIYFGPRNLSQFDHLVFPGAVPRSFIPSFLLAATSYLPLVVLKSLGLITTSADVQYALRIILSTLWAGGLIFFIERVSAHLRLPFVKAERCTQAQQWFRRMLLVISAVQFHLPYWAGRTTPNGLAMPAVLVALGLILPRGLAYERSHQAGLALLTFLAVVYRLELIGILAASTLYLFHSRIYFPRFNYDNHPVESIAKLAASVQASLTLSATLSAVVDHYMWKSTSWLPPEVQAVKFNVVDGKSAEWGVSPWHAYFTSMVPKLLSFSAPLVVFGVLVVLVATFTSQKSTAVSKEAPPGRQFHGVDDVRAAQESGKISPLVFVFISLFHVGLLSILGHKEWRFVTYVVPLLNVLGGITATMFITPSSFAGLSRLPVFLRLLLPLSVIGLLSLCAAATSVSTLASMGNYPGGEALSRLHSSLENTTTPVHVHIDVLPAMTGVTLFQSLHLPRPPSLLWPPAGSASASRRQSWIYNKTENLSPTSAKEWEHFTHLVSEWPECRSSTSRLAEVNLFRPLAAARSTNEVGDAVAEAQPLHTTSEFAGIHFRLYPISTSSSHMAARGWRFLNNDFLQIEPFSTLDATVADGKFVNTEGWSLTFGSSRQGGGRGGLSKEEEEKRKRKRKGISVGFKTRRAVWICERAV